MKKTILSLIRKFPTSRLILERQFLNKHYLNEVGWNKSIKKLSSIDNNDSPIPWISYPCIYFLKDRIKQDFSIFEYGSGNSTLWLADRSKNLISVEHDKDWFDKMNKSINEKGIKEYAHITLEGGLYEREILKYHNQVDLLFIDGRNRVKCCFNGINSLTGRGVIIFDNSYRPEYVIAMDALIKNGFKRIDFWGMGPIGHSHTCTSIFYRTINCLGI